MSVNFLRKKQVPCAPVSPSYRGDQIESEPVEAGACPSAVVVGITTQAATANSDKHLWVATRKDLRFCIFRSSMILIDFASMSFNLSATATRALRTAFRKSANIEGSLGKTFPIIQIFRRSQKIAGKENAPKRVKFPRWDPSLTLWIGDRFC